MAFLPKVAIIELGSQYTLVIERTLRELGVRAVILEPRRAAEWLSKHPVRAVILSGSVASVYEKNAPQPPNNILSMSNESGEPLPVLGICYGMQWITHTLGGKVESVVSNREYGQSYLGLRGEPEGLFAGTARTQQIWASHGDSVTKAPPGFVVTARSGHENIAAMEKGYIYGVQFHPEAPQTQYGQTILKNFLSLAGCKKDWQPSSTEVLR